MDTPSSNKGWHGDWFFIKGPDTELVGPWSNPNTEQLNPNQISQARLEAFEVLYPKRPSMKWSRDLLNDQDWLHSFGLADQGKNSNNEVILEAAGVPRAKPSGLDKIRTARSSKTLPPQSTKPATNVGGASGSSQPAPKEAREGPTSPTGLRPIEPKLKRRRLVLRSSVEGGSTMVPSAGGSTVPPTVDLAAEEQDKMSVGSSLPIQESPIAEGPGLTKKKGKSPSPSPAAAEGRTSIPEERSGPSVLGSSMIPFDATGIDKSDLKSLMDMLFSFHAKGNAVLLRVSDEQKALERQLEAVTKECDEAKQAKNTLRSQLTSQHDAFRHMIAENDLIRKEKAGWAKETGILKDQLFIAEEKSRKSESRVEDYKKLLEDKNFQLQAQKEQFNQSCDMVQLQTNQLKNLKENIEMIVEGWSAKEADWLKGPVDSASPSLLAPSLRKSVVNEYKASDEFQQDTYVLVANEFNDGFEFARELLREKGHDPDALGLTIPEDE